MRAFKGLAAGAALLLAVPGASQTEIARLTGAATGDQYGWALASVDLDGDGRDDVVVGAPGSDAACQDGGWTEVVSLEGGVLVSFAGAGPGELLGSAVAPLGYVDTDATPDLLVGIPGRGAAGAVAVHSGAGGGELYDVLHTGPGTMGHVVATGGNVDSDGIGDFVAVNYSAPWGLSVVGDATVHSGANGALLRTHTSSFIHGHPFRSAAFFPDVDGNGLDEYLLGGVADMFCYSEIDAFRGSNGALLWSDDGLAFTEYGFSVLFPGDLDGDQAPDVVGFGRGYPLGCFGTQPTARILSAQSGALITQYNALPYWGSDFKEMTVVALGDADGDGTPEYAVGSEDWQVTIFSGLSTSPALTLPATAPDGFARTLAAGDFNGDGLRDLAIGSYKANGAGEVGIFTVVLNPTRYCTALPNSQGCVPEISFTGTPSLTAGTFRIRAQNVLNTKPGLLFWGLGPESTPFLGATLCVRPPLARTTVQFSGGNPPPDDCSGTYSFHFSAAYMASVGLSAGDRVYAQYWARDPSAITGTSLSDALAFPILP